MNVCEAAGTVAASGCEPSRSLGGNSWERSCAYEAFWDGKKQVTPPGRNWEDIDPTYREFWCKIAAAVLESYLDATLHPRAEAPINPGFEP